MNIAAIDEGGDGFQVLQTTQRTQTAVMILEPGASSSREMNTHQNSDHVLLLLEGELQAEMDGKKHSLKKNEVCLVPAGTPHRFENLGNKRAVTFNVYSPPEYPAGAKD